MNKHKPISDKELATMKARCDAATPGPWAWEFYGRNNAWCLGTVLTNHEGQIVEEYDDEKEEWLPRPEVVEFICESGSDATPSDANFISHARTDLPRALAEVERLRDELVDKEAAVAQYWEEILFFQAECAKLSKQYVDATAVIGCLGKKVEDTEEELTSLHQKIAARPALEEENEAQRADLLRAESQIRFLEDKFQISNYYYEFEEYLQKENARVTTSRRLDLKDYT